jgi:hypothetical protein
MLEGATPHPARPLKETSVKPNRILARACNLAAAISLALPAQPAAALADRLPAALRPAGQAVLDAAQPAARAAALSKLVAAAPGAQDADRLAALTPFLIGLYDAGACPEASPAFTSRSSGCLAYLARTLHHSADPALLAQFERWGASHPNAALAVQALERLAAYRQDTLAATLRQRILLARAANDTEALLALGRLQETTGSQLPSFFWDAPPRFEAAPAGDSLRVVAIGDSGTGSPIQQACADSIARLHRQQPFQFGITLGDNYQDNGSSSPTDPRWQKYWERFYPQLGIPFYATLGNHDWNNPAGPAAELLYRNPSWKLPALYYTYTAGPVQFFVLNTPLLSERQRLWLDRELAASTARWKVVYGHFQIYSALRGDHPQLIPDILPLLEAHNVDIYFCGHEHLFQHLKPKGHVQLFVNGASGAGARSARQKNYPNVLFMAEGKTGFSTLEATRSEFTVRFIDQAGDQLYAYTLRK